MRIQIAFIIMFIASWGLSLMFSPPCLAEFVSAPPKFNCFQTTDRRNSVICAPPRGSLAQNSSGKYVCGAGQCVIKSNGKVICSAVPGGALAWDSRSRDLCVGGCMEASESLCVSPVPDQS